MARARVRIPPILVQPRTLRVWLECRELARMLVEFRPERRGKNPGMIESDASCAGRVIAAALVMARTSMIRELRIRHGMDRARIEARLAALEMPRGSTGKPLKPAAGALRTGAAPAQAQQDPPPHGPGFGQVLTKKARGKGLAW